MFRLYTTSLPGKRRAVFRAINERPVFHQAEHPQYCDSEEAAISEHSVVRPVARHSQEGWKPLPIPSRRISSESQKEKPDEVQAACHLKLLPNPIGQGVRNPGCPFFPKEIIGR